MLQIVKLQVHERQTARMRTRSEWFLGDRQDGTLSLVVSSEYLQPPSSSSLGLHSGGLSTGSYQSKTKFSHLNGHIELDNNSINHSDSILLIPSPFELLSSASSLALSTNIIDLSNRSHEQSISYNSYMQQQHHRQANGDYHHQVDGINVHHNSPGLISLRSRMLLAFFSVLDFIF